MNKHTLILALATTTAAAISAANAQQISFSIGPQYAYRAPAPASCYPPPVTTIRYSYGPTIQTYTYPAPYTYRSHTPYYRTYYTPRHHTRAPRGWVPAYYNTTTHRIYIPRANTHHPRHASPRQYR
ncbi:MAG: hypothetical protein M9963_07875 [Kiritimatiellae bacterium]|nr:hypothetical protein [Kiritimatiellia bacterium]